MEGTISLYLQKRMKKLGFSDFSFEIKRITVNNEVYKIPSSLDFYYLFDVDNVTDHFTIESDNNHLTNLEFVSVGVPYFTTEFSGNLEIDTTGSVAAHNFLFYVVTPEFEVELKELDPTETLVLNSNQKQWKFSRIMNFINKTKKLLQSIIPKKNDTAVSKDTESNSYK